MGRLLSFKFLHQNEAPLEGNFKDRPRFAECYGAQAKMNKNEMSLRFPIFARHQTESGHKQAFRYAGQRHCIDKRYT